MKIENALTILTPLWGRDKETFRLLKYLNSVKCPFKILFADGARDMSSEILGKYPDLNIEYFFNGPDTTINDFIGKMHKAFSMIKTPLTIMLDNDDFISMSGMVEGIKFLSENRDFSSYRERICPAHESRDVYMRSHITDADVYDRLSNSINNRSAGWHDITYTYIHEKLFNILHHSGTNDLQLVFSMVTYWYNLYGLSYKGTENPYYYHVDGNSLVQGRNLYSKYGQWLLDEKFEDSMMILISSVGNFISRFYGYDLKESKEKFARIVLTDIYKYSGASMDCVDPHIKYCVDKSRKYDEQFHDILQVVNTTPKIDKLDNDLFFMLPHEEVQLLRSLI